MLIIFLPRFCIISFLYIVLIPLLAVKNIDLVTLQCLFKEVLLSVFTYFSL